jgi:hypothetical protein
MSEDLPTIILVGASDKSQKAIGREYASGEDPLLQIAHGFGGFGAAVAYVGQHPLPDFVHIANNTCMDPSDLVNGCRKLAQAIVVKTKADVDPPTIVIEDKGLRHLGGEFAERALPVEFDSLLHVLGFTEVEPTRYVR